MNFFIVVLFLCFFIFLFSLYFFAHDDLTLFKKDASMDRLFNIAFVLSFVSLFTARIFYVLLNPSTHFLNPLVFFLFPYFPGLSLTGGVVGGAFFLFIILRMKKMPLGRIFDFFSLSFLTCLPVGFLGFFLLSHTNLISLSPLVILAFYTLLFIMFSFFLLPRLLKGKFRDGTLGLLFLLSFSLFSLVEKIVDKKAYFGIEEITLVLLFVISLGLLAKREELVSKFRNIKKISK